jgi:hypothetical protein
MNQRRPPNRLTKTITRKNRGKAWANSVTRINARSGSSLVVRKAAHIFRSADRTDRSLTSDLSAFSLTASIRCA